MPGFGHRSLYFSLRDGKESNGNTACSFESGVILHNMSVASALGVVISALKQRWETEWEEMKACVVRPSKLTRRQKEVIICITQGMALGEIARELNISAKTVSSHKTAIMRKMGFRRNSELYRWLRNGI